ncbi:putative stress up-regulated Nod 19 [Rosa chinensis]|uniref:Putative stress up-regulated Nod 19 n=1 Tax=Rosa chinensis TaxID=74649 RepID=A0A2P6SHL1_ROSCH|nr:putative stress up-regulated Nod 19 [Rosa chinensis]
MKYFNAEVIDERDPVPLHETYLHHWVIEKYYAQTSSMEPEQIGFEDIKEPDFKVARNSRLCYCRDSCWI